MSGSRTYVYLAGSITGEVASNAIHWRQDIIGHFRWLDPSIVFLNPLRGESIPTDGVYKFNNGSNDGEIYTKNKFDIYRADIIFAYLPNGNRVSIGTMFEIAWACKEGKAIILVTDNPDISEHPLVKRICPVIYNNLADGYDYLHVLAGN